MERSQFLEYTPRERISMIGKLMQKSQKYITEDSKGNFNLKRIDFQIFTNYRPNWWINLFPRFTKLKITRFDNYRVFSTEEKKSGITLRMLLENTQKIKLEREKLSHIDLAYNYEEEEFLRKFRKGGSNSFDYYLNETSPHETLEIVAFFI